MFIVEIHGDPGVHKIGIAGAIAAALANLNMKVSVVDDNCCYKTGPQQGGEACEVRVLAGDSQLASGAVYVATERARQMHEEGWTSGHDDEHDDHSLALAACAYIAPEPLLRRIGKALVDIWPESWSPLWDKRPRVAGGAGALATAGQTDIDQRIRALVKGAALACAEIDRLSRKQRTLKAYDTHIIGSGVEKA